MNILGHRHVPSNIKVNNKKPSVFNNKKLKVAGAVAMALIIWALTSTPPEQQEVPLNSQAPEPRSPQSTDPLSQLTPEQKILIEDTYNLAKTLYTQGRYESALIELKKLNQLVPNYKDSKELLLYAQEGVATKAQQDEIARRKREERELKNKIRSIIQDCEYALGARINIADAEKCLAPALELDPDNTAAKALLRKAEQTQFERMRKSSEQKAYKEKIEKIQKVFKEAQESETIKDWPAALAGYELVLKLEASDSADIKQKAKDKIVKIKEQLANEVKKLIQSAKQLHSQGEYKQAMAELLTAGKFDPQNATIKELYEKSNTELYKKLKTIYGDSVLEENLGNVESAKNKWKNILETDVRGGEYYLKARQKLKKYGEIKEVEQ